MSPTRRWILVAFIIPLVVACSTPRAPKARGTTDQPVPETKSPPAAPPPAKDVLPEAGSEPSPTGNASAGPVAVGTQIDQEAPDFTLKDLSGRPVRLADLRGQPVFINFWATWCGPCKIEMPDIEKVYEAHKDSIHVLSVDVGEDLDTVLAYRQKLGLHFPMVLDSTTSVARKYQVVGLPTSFFLDKHGIIRDRYLGAMSRIGMEEGLSEAQRGMSDR